MAEQAPYVRLHGCRSSARPPFGEHRRGIERTRCSFDRRLRRLAFFAPFWAMPKRGPRSWTARKKDTDVKRQEQKWIPAFTGMATRESALLDGRVSTVFRPGVIRARTDDLAVDALFDHVRAPAGSARDHEQRREHRRRHAQHVIDTGRIPVEVREHLLEFHHHILDPLGYLEQARIAAVGAQLARDLLDDGVARVADGVDRVAEADHDLLVGDALADVGLGLVRAAIA